MGFTVPNDGGGGAADAERATGGTVLGEVMVEEMYGYTVPSGEGGCAIDPELVKGCIVSGGVVAVYVGWVTGPVYGATGGIGCAATEGGTGRDATEGNTVPSEVVAGDLG